MSYTISVETPTMYLEHGKRCKWRKGAVVCADIGQVMNSCTAFGGVWRNDIGRFANRSWVMSQQLNYLLMRIRKGAYWYPERVAHFAKPTKKGTEHGGTSGSQDHTH